MSNFSFSQSRHYQLSLAESTHALPAGTALFAAAWCRDVANEQIWRRGTALVGLARNAPVVPANATAQMQSPQQAAAKLHSPVNG